MSFIVLEGAGGAAARLGRLIVPDRKPVDTPNFIDTASRGAIPHLTIDVLTKHTEVNGAYMALEDCESTHPTAYTDSLLTNQS